MHPFTMFDSLNTSAISAKSAMHFAPHTALNTYTIFTTHGGLGEEQVRLENIDLIRAAAGSLDKLRLRQHVQSRGCQSLWCADRCSSKLLPKVTRCLDSSAV